MNVTDQGVVICNVYLSPNSKNKKMYQKMLQPIIVIIDAAVETLKME